MLESLTAAPLYRSRPLSGPSQPPYLNTLLLGVTAAAAADLLAIGKALELAAGRRPGPRHGPRQLDIDLLFHGTTTSDLPELTLPHPGLRQRRFVLEPLAALAPTLPLPPDGLAALELLARLPVEPGIELLAGSWLSPETAG